jgi:large subunit ribosomal protein L30e
MTDVLDEVRAAIKEKEVVIGTDETMKLLRKGKVRKVYLASNVGAAVKQDIHHYGALGQVPIVGLDITNEQLGTLCKKPFSISVISIRAE